MRMTIIAEIPGHPNRVTRIAKTPIKEKGVTKEAKNTGDFVSIVLKSFESKLMIFPNYCDFAVY